MLARDECVFCYFGVEKLLIFAPFDLKCTSRPLFHIGFLLICSIIVGNELIEPITLSFLNCFISNPLKFALLCCFST